MDDEFYRIVAPLIDESQPRRPPTWVSLVVAFGLPFLSVSAVFIVVAVLIRVL